MTQDDVLFGYRLRLFALAGEVGVSEACRVMGVHRSTYYRWKHQVDRQGLEMLRPRERRMPQMPNQIPQIVEERIVAFSLGHPGLGPRRVAAMLARPEWGGLRVSPNGIWKVLRRHGISTRTKRLSLIAGYRARVGPPREPDPEPHITTTRPGELVGIDCFFVGRLSETKGAVWQITAIDTYSSYAWTDLVRAPTSGPTVKHTTDLAAASAPTSPPPAGRCNACSPTTATSSATRTLAVAWTSSAPATPASAPAAPRPTDTSNASTARSSKNAGGPPSRASTSPATPASSATSRPTPPTTTTTAHTPDASPTDEPQPNSSTVPTKWSRDDRPPSAQLGARSRRATLGQAQASGHDSTGPR